MPLPTTNQAWPPATYADITTHHREWDAWYVGTPEALRAVYQHGNSAHPSGRALHYIRPEQYAGGIVGTMARLWWGKPAPGPGVTSREQLHIPMARDIAITAADLIYAEPPTFTSGNAATNDRLDQYTDDGWHSELAAGAEIGAALGSRYMRVTWDRTVSDRPFLTTVHADDAYPEFRFGRLTALTISTTVHTENDIVWRWLERHELDDDGNGLIYHGLYQGDRANLGRPVPLQDQPATEPLANIVDEDGAVIEGRTPGLCVVHVPNRTPAPEWRHHHVGRYLGVSDYASTTGLMDALDETWSSWMRDIRIGKGRIVAAEAMFESDTAGRVFNYDREVFELVNALPDSTNGMPIHQVQFNIRVQEHAETASALVKQIIEQSGYSLASFGEHTEDADITATEVRARQKKSLSTRGRKIRHERPALTELARKMLTIDQAVFGTPGLAPDSVKVEFPDAIQTSSEEQARTASMLRTARLMSIETGVRLIHPDWDDTDVAEEVARLAAEDGTPDPFDAVPAGAETPDPDDGED